MMNEQKSGLGTIYRGELIYYYPLKFDTSLDFSTLCNHVAQSVENAFSSCRNKAAVTLKSDIQAQLDKTEATENEPQKVPSCLFRDAKITLNPTPASLQLAIYPGCMTAHFKRNGEGENEYNLYKTIYGEPFVSLHDRIPLPPLNVTLYNDEKVWLNAFLTVFKNKMGILKLELPLANITAEHFKDYNTDAYVSSIIGGCFAHEETSSIPFSEIYKFYIEKILSWSASKRLEIFCGAPISNIILGHCEGTPLKIENIPHPVQTDLYEIIAAPIGERDNISTTSDAETYLLTHSWGNHFIRCFTSTTGGCLTLIEKEIVEKRISEYVIESGLSPIDEQVKSDVYQDMIQSAAINTEFSLTILALKKMNNEYVLCEKAAGRHALLDIQTQYNKTLIFIAELQRACMGTVHEQLQAFEKTMPYYLSSNLTEIKLSAIDQIRSSEETSIRERSQSLVSLLGLILTAVFGLPAIHDTISFLHAAVWPDHADIPYFSIKAASVICWLALLIGLSIWSYITMRKRH